MSMKNSNDTIGNRTRDLPTCSTVPQPSALPAACPLLGCVFRIIILLHYIHYTKIWHEKPTDVTISILFIYRRISTCFGPTGPSSGEFTQLFMSRSGLVLRSTRPERYRYWTNGCVNSCVNSPEDGPVGPKHVEARRYMNKIEIVTYVGFSFHKRSYTCMPPYTFDREYIDTEERTPPEQAAAPIAMQ